MLNVIILNVKDGKLLQKGFIILAAGFESPWVF
jgi:hypothetical protein